ncbi:MAG: hypothetical protein MJH09_10765 [Cetobacterium sp.]|nr:hypothetical protein [Cetobacterium sp.]
MHKKINKTIESQDYIHIDNLTKLRKDMKYSHETEALRIAIKFLENERCKEYELRESMNTIKGIIADRNGVFIYREEDEIKKMRDKSEINSLEYAIKEISKRLNQLGNE